MLDEGDYLGISLFISSRELTPSAITHAVGIEPTYCRERGTPIRGDLTRRPEFDLHEWQFREQLYIQPDDYISNHSERFISKFLNRIRDTAPRVRELSKDHDVLIQIVYSAHSMPYIGLTSGHIRDIASLGARLDYDIMIDEGRADKT